MFIEKSLSKIRLRNGDDVFLMVDYELNNKLFVKILNLKHNEVYIGQLNDIELRTQAARIRLTFDEFSQKVMKALIESASDNSNFIYSLDEQDDMYKFHWKSIDEDQTIISLGYVFVRKESFTITLTDMLETISVEMRLMRNKIQELNTELNNTKNQTSDALKQLKLATEVKEKLEKEMFSKFALVLNEKKRKIRELQQKNKHGSHSSKIEFQKKKPKILYKPLASDSSEDADEIEDKDEPGPSNAKNESFLFHDDNEPILPSNRSRIRNRKVLVSKKDNENKSTDFISSRQSSKNISVDDDESDEHLFDNL